MHDISNQAHLAGGPDQATSLVVAQCAEDVVWRLTLWVDLVGESIQRSRGKDVAPDGQGRIADGCGLRGHQK